MSELSRCHILGKSSYVYQHCNGSIHILRETYLLKQRLDLLLFLVYGYRDVTTISNPIRESMRNGCASPCRV